MIESSDGNKKREGGLIVDLDEEFPTLICVGEVVIKVYLLTLRSGKTRARFVSSREEVDIYGPNRVKKGCTGNVKID